MILIIGVVALTSCKFTEEISKSEDITVANKFRDIIDHDVDTTYFEHCFDCNQVEESEYQGSYENEGKLSIRWEKAWKSVVETFADFSIKSLNTGWSVLDSNTDNIYGVSNCIIDTSNGETVEREDVPCNGAYNPLFRKNAVTVSPINTIKISDNTLMIIANDIHYIDCNTNDVVLTDEEAKMPGYFRITNKYIYYAFNHNWHSEELNIYTREINNINYKIDIGSFENVFCFNDRVWLQDGTKLVEYIENDNTFGDTINAMSYVSDNNSDKMDLLGYDYFNDHILGYIYTDEKNKKDYSFDAYEHYFPLTRYPQMGLYDRSVTTYFLFHPEHPQDVVYLDEDILGSMDARVKVLGAHFIVENNEVLKCIDPFKGEDIWWIDREDVGQEAKILWADERGVLVYSRSHRKLYCFE